MLWVLESCQAAQRAMKKISIVSSKKSPSLGEIGGYKKMCSPVPDLQKITMTFSQGAEHHGPDQTGILTWAPSNQRITFAVCLP